MGLGPVDLAPTLRPSLIALLFDTLESITVFVARQRLHIRYRVALVHNLSTQQGLYGVLEGHNTGGLTELILN